MGPKSERVYRTIREWVASGKFQPGEKLPSERTLEKELEIGRTQLRTVLAKLVAEKVIESSARSSYRVPAREVSRAPAVSIERPDDLDSWQIHGERTVYDNRWVKLALVDVEPPGVERFEHHVVRLHHVSIAAVLDDQDRVLMLWRYRFVPDKWGWELPGGIVDEGEDPLRDRASRSRGRDRLASGLPRSRGHLPAHGGHGRLAARDLRGQGCRARW